MASATQPDQTATGAPGGVPLPVQMLEITTGGMRAQMVGVVARLGIADVLADGPRSTEEIAAVVGAHASTLHRLLRAVSDMGIVADLDDGRFALAPLGELLRSDVPGSLRAWATVTGLPMHRDPWTDLYESVRSGEPAFPRVHGMPLFSHLAANPDDAAVFDGAMTSLALSMQAAIVGAYDFSDSTTVVDVGGGAGALLAAILRANPGLRGVLVDQPEVIARAEATLQRSGVADRIERVPADIMEAVPARGDLYVLSNILHDWDDATCLRILASCRDAMPAGARLLVVELVLPEGAAPSLAKQVDLEMLVITGGRQRTPQQFGDLLARSGLRMTRAVASIMGQPASYVEAIRD